MAAAAKTTVPSSAASGSESTAADTADGSESWTTATDTTTSYEYETATASSEEPPQPTALQRRARKLLFSQQRAVLAIFATAVATVAPGAEFSALVSRRDALLGSIVAASALNDANADARRGVDDAVAAVLAAVEAFRLRHQVGGSPPVAH